MSRIVARAESFERVYDAFNNINFAAFDFDTVKQSLLDYVKLYFPETFNDFIESSEFIAIVETFAYIAELLAYRIDINAHENFISTAQRKDSILRLAKLVSYTASRPLPARGLVKITSVSTTESVFDTNGIDLAGTRIIWNDASNPNWKDQFILIMNRVMEQSFGTVGPTDRFQIQDVLFEMYSWNLTPIASGVFSYTAVANGKSAPMELVPVEYDATFNIIERRPQDNANFTFLYGQDGLGDASNTTGFFCFTKQGSLRRFRTTFDGVTPNQTYDVELTNVNDIDVWLNNVNPSTNEILDTPSTLPYRREALEGKSGEWVQVDLAHAQNVIFNTNPRRNKYEVETQDDNRIRLIFGDGEFADVPSGTFDIWARTSLDEDVVIPQSSVSNSSASFSYVDVYGRTQTFTFTFSLTNTLQNASASEDIEHIRVTAPAVYYAQDRMVNAEDYNVFMLQDPSILKLKAINRTFAGDSKYIAWHDASGTYENVKIFGNDGVLYFNDVPTSTSTPVVDVNQLITAYVEPLLSSTDLTVQLMSHGVDVSVLRRIFTDDEKTSIVASLTAPPMPVEANLYYNTTTNVWYAVKASETDLVTALGPYGWPSDFITTPLINISQSATEESYMITRLARRIVFQSQTTSFWNTNDANRVIEYDTLDSNYDNIVLLQANVNADRTGLFATDQTFTVIGQEVNESGPEIALPDIHRLSVLPDDENADGVPDNLELLGIINPTVTVVGQSHVFVNAVTSGQGYTSGVYTNVPLTGGSGTGAVANIVVGSIPSVKALTIQNAGLGYVPGTYTNVPLIGGSSTGATADVTITANAFEVVSLTGGDGYTTPGTYTNVPLTGGSGTGATADITVVSTGTIGTHTTAPGTLYLTSGTYTNVPLTGGSGTGATADITVTHPSPQLTNLVGGDGYTTPGTYTSVPLTGGSGTGATADITVTLGAIDTVSHTLGTLYLTNGSYTNVPLIGGSGTGATVDVTISGGSVGAIAINNAGSGYVAGDQMYVDSGAVGGIAAGGTEFTVSVTTISGEVTDVVLTYAGTGYTGGNILSCNAANIGGIGVGGTPFAIQISADYTAGTVSNVTIVSGGINYTNGDVLSCNAGDIGGIGLSGTEFNIVVTSTTGYVTTVDITNAGQGYAPGDVLTAVNSSIGGNVGGTSFGATLGTFTGGVSSIVVVDGGDGYIETDTFLINAMDVGGSGTGFVASILSLDAGVTSVNLVEPGQGYTTGETLTASSGILGTLGSGFGVSIIVTALGDPQVVQLPISYIGAVPPIDPPEHVGCYGDIEWVSGSGSLVQAPVNVISNAVTVTGDLVFKVKEYVYFVRETVEDPWIPAPTTAESISAYLSDLAAQSDPGYTPLWKRHEGRTNINFAWFHRTPNYHLVDPAPSNIIDTFIITKGYYTSLKRWLEDASVTRPTAPTALDLRTSYNYLLDNRMISDTVILHPGKFKLLFGTKAPTSLQAKFKVVRSPDRTLTDNQIKTRIVTTIRNFFDISLWDFGNTFYATELFAAIHAALPSEISSVILVPTLSQNQFGDLFQVPSREDEVFYPDISVNDIEIVSNYTSSNMRLESQ